MPQHIYPDNIPNRLTSYCIRAMMFLSGGPAASDKESQMPKTQVTAPPLANYAIVGIFEKSYQATPDAPVQPAGTCWHCGLAILHCVRVRHTQTGEEHDIGTTCAERAGLDRTQLRAMLAEKHASERHARSAAERREAEAAHQKKESQAALEHGAHGTESRFASGCRCNECRATAPHGTLERLEDGNCECAKCVENAIKFPAYRKEMLTVLLDASTGAILPAHRVTTRYGSRWVVEDENGNASWYPFLPARRSTLITKGVLEADAEHLVRVGRNGFFPMFVTQQPETDRWGEPIIRS